MKIIILAGGTGKRFWPASRKSSPKQFLPVIGEEPLIKLKYDYLRLEYEPEDIFLSTGAQYEQEVKDILPELPNENFIFEPAMRDNGPAVLYATEYVANMYPDEVISIQWSDHYIKKPEVFVHALATAEKVVKQEGKTVNIAERPRFPSPHRGYLKYGKKLRGLDGGDNIVLNEFIRFVEKPTLEVAKEYVRSGDYAWNLGYMVMKPDHIRNKYEKFAPTVYKTVKEIADNDFSPESQEKFKELDKIAFDYIFGENLEPDEAYVITTDMGWHDVGEWISLKEALEEDSEDVVTMGNVKDIGSEDTLVYNYEDKKLIATMNLDEMIVVNTKDVVAIFHKDDNARIKEFLKKLEEEGKGEYL